MTDEPLRQIDTPSVQTSPISESSTGFTGGSAVQQPTTMEPGGGVPFGEPGGSADRWPTRPTYVPLVDIFNTSDEIKVIVDTPGFNEDDISLECDDGLLVITGERDPEVEPHEVETTTNSHVERPHYLERRIQLPASTDPDDAWAHNENGTTTITFKKDESESHHQIGFQ